MNELEITQKQVKRKPKASLVVSIVFGIFLVGFNLAFLYNVRRARISLAQARSTQAATAQRLVEFKNEINKMAETQLEVQATLKAFRPSMVEALQAGMQDIQLDETLICEAGDSETANRSFYIWLPQSGQSLWGQLKVSAPFDLGAKESDQERAVMKFAKPLTAQRLHLVKYHWVPMHSDVLFEVAVDGEMAFSHPAEGYSRRSSWSLDNNWLDVFSEPNMMGSVWRIVQRKEEVLDRIRNRIWLPIPSSTCVLGNKESKQQKHASFDWGIQSSEPLLIREQSSRPLDKLLELEKTSREGVKRIMGIVSER